MNCRECVRLVRIINWTHSRRLFKEFSQQKILVGSTPTFPAKLGKRLCGEAKKNSDLSFKYRNSKKIIQQTLNLQRRKLDTVNYGDNKVGRPVAKQSYFTNKFNQLINEGDNIIVVTTSQHRTNVRLGKFKYANLDCKNNVTSVVVTVEPRYSFSKTSAISYDKHVFKL